MPENQYKETCAALRSEIDFVRAGIAAGKRVSEMANELHAQGIGTMHIIVIFREATGAPLRHLKSFGQWWSEEGVTDADAFDAWAAEVFER